MLTKLKDLPLQNHLKLAQNIPFSSRDNNEIAGNTLIKLKIVLLHNH